MSLHKMAGVFLLAGALLGITPAGAGQWADGAQVYQKVCAHCHEAGVGPLIKGRNLPPEYIQHVVRHGNRAMPSFRPSEIDAVALADVARVVSTSVSVVQK